MMVHGLAIESWIQFPDVPLSRTDQWASRENTHPFSNLYNLVVAKGSDTRQRGS